MDAALRALAEPRRREILDLVRTRERSAGDIATYFDVSRPAISQHLGVLQDAGLVSVRRDGNRRWYRSRPEGMAELREYLEGFWSIHLATLKDEAEQEERRRRGRHKR